MNHNFKYLLISILVILSTGWLSCGGGQSEASDQASESTETLSTELTDDKFISKEKMQNILNLMDKVELILYLDQGMVSTDVTNTIRIGYFAHYINPEPAKVSVDCPATGSAVFINGRGEIVIDAEFNIEEPCNHIRMKFQDQMYYQSFSEHGIKYIQDFLDFAAQGRQN